MGVAISVATFIAWFVLIGMSVRDNRFFYWMITNAVLLVVSQPWLMRISRSIWLSWFVKYDPHWKVHSLAKEDIERIIPEQQMN
jgi:hypothetical protein